MKRSELKEMIRDEVKRIFNESRFTGRPTLGNKRESIHLRSALNDAIKKAEALGKQLQGYIDDDDVPVDMGDMVQFDSLLRQIYNGYMTGNRKNDVSDEIFK